MLKNALEMGVSVMSLGIDGDGGRLGGGGDSMIGCAGGGLGGFIASNRTLWVSCTARRSQRVVELKKYTDVHACSSNDLIVSISSLCG